VFFGVFHRWVLTITIIAIILYVAPKEPYKLTTYMARPFKEVNAKQIAVINKYRVGGMKMEAAMEKLGVNSTTAFYTIFHHSTMALN
jgi:hypothetical protein